MTWMLTASGKQFDLDFVATDAIDIQDIAHHLAQINRFTGACVRPYSVAEHSLLVSCILEAWGADPQIQFAGLLHDAHEAYTNDLSSPMKQTVGDAWRTVERRVESAVHDHFGVAGLMKDPAVVDAVKAADLTALVTERAALLPSGGPRWQAEAIYAPVQHDFAADANRTWAHWRNAYVLQFARLSTSAFMHLRRAAP